MQKAVLTKEDFKRMREEGYVKWYVKIGIREKLSANFPDNPEALKMAIAMAKKKEKLSEEEASELAEEMNEDLEGMEESTGKLVFIRDEKGFYIRPRHIKGLLKEVMMRCLNIRGARDYINHAVIVEPTKIYMKRNGRIITEPDGEEVLPISVITRKGRRNSVTVAEVLYAPVEMEFYILIPKTIARSKFTDEVIIKAWLYAQDVGLLGKRSIGESGQFDVLELRKVKE